MKNSIYIKKIMFDWLDLKKVDIASRIVEKSDGIIISHKKCLSFSRHGIWGQKTEKVRI